MLIFDQLKKNDTHLRILAWLVLAGMLVLLASVWFIQIPSHRYFAENQKAQSFRTVRIPAIRGKILDAQGRALAENRPDYNVSLYLEELREQFKAEWRRQRPQAKVPRATRAAMEAQTRYRVASNIVHQLGVALGEPLTLDSSQFVHHYTNQLPLPFQILAISNQTQLARFHEQQQMPPGMDIDMQPMRFYPHRFTAAHLLGYLKFNNASTEGEDAFFNYRLPDYQGNMVGIEGVFDAELRGIAGVKSVLVNNLGYRQSENIWLPAEAGKNVILTIDLDIQQAAERALQDAMKNVRGAVVVMDPNTADILAMVSAPAFDPNIFLPRITKADWERLSDENIKPQRNRATQENYHPGSIFKVVTALACLESGLNPEEKIHNPGYIQIGRRTIHDTAAAGDYNFRRAFIKSSNTYFISNGLRCGMDAIVRIGERLHLGQRTGIPTMQDSPGTFPDWKRIRQGWVAGDTANAAIGQGEVFVTPLQMAVMISAIANGGKVFYPRLVRRIQPQDPTSGEAPEIFPPARLRDELGVSPRTLQIIRESMLADVEDKNEGTGTGAAVPGFRVCGKTGTAQVGERKEGFDHTTWFASYAPYEKPRYVVIVMVESGSSGGLTCAPVAQKVYQALQKLETEADKKNSALARNN